MTDYHGKSAPDQTGAALYTLDDIRDRALAKTFWPLLLLGTFALAGGLLSEWEEGRPSMMLVYLAFYAASLSAVMDFGLSYRTRVAILVLVFHALALSELFMFGVASMAALAFVFAVVFSSLFFTYGWAAANAAFSVLSMAAMAVLYLSGMVAIETEVQQVSANVFPWLSFFMTYSLIVFMLMRVLRQFIDTLQFSLSSSQNLVSQLRENEFTLRQVIDLVPESVYAKDEESRFIFVNRRSAELMGTTPEEAVGKTQAELTPLSAEAAALIAEDREVFRSGNAIVRREHLYTDAQGICHAEETTKIPFTTRLSEGKAILGISIDITERKKAEDKVRRSEEHFRQLIENISDVLMVITPAGEVRYTSPSAERVLGYPAAMPMRDNLLELVHAEDRGAVSDAIAQGAQRLGEVMMVECRVRHQKGHWVAVEASGQGLLDAEGQVRGVIAFRDMTERKQAAAERDRLMSAIEQAGETVVITDPHGVIQYVNPAFVECTGYTREEALGKNPKILKSGLHDTLFYGHLWNTLCSGRPWTGRFMNRRKDGTLFTGEATISPVLDPAGGITNYVAVQRDITREIDLEQQLHQAQKMEAVGQLAGGVAHDFNNLLQAISGYTELLLAQAPVGGRERPMLTQIAGAAERAAGLTRQLLAFSRRQVIEPKLLDLNGVVSNLIELVHRVIGENIKIELIPGFELGQVLADRGQIEQVLMNLCVNARDAMPDGGRVTIETENLALDRVYCEDHAWAKPGRYVALSVSDTGTGMDAETLGHIFEPFFTTKEVGKGTGLGLATAYGIAVQHDGMIRVYSEPGIGSTFRLYLPLAGQQPIALEDETEEEVPGGTETILLAEDDDFVRGLAERLLLEAGYTVLTTEDGEEGLHMFLARADEIDLVLLDVVMPRMGGPTAYQRMREIRPSVRALFASGYPEKGVNVAPVMMEGLHFIQKPYRRADLLRRVRALLDA
ncbi:MAG: PAS domain S-box protein [Candidatus Hydrogenedentes bacterium]|nr:PAS domain S-box protein [Candidatus Hydrogenedentota bacterium]